MECSRKYRSGGKASGAHSRRYVQVRSQSFTSGVWRGSWAGRNRWLNFASRNLVSSATSSCCQKVNPLPYFPLKRMNRREHLSKRITMKPENRELNQLGQLCGRSNGFAVGKAEGCPVVTGDVRWVNAVSPKADWLAVAVAVTQPTSHILRHRPAAPLCISTCPPPAQPSALGFLDDH